MKPRKWTPDLLSEMMRMKRNGMTDKEVSQKMGFTVNAIREARHRYFPGGKRFTRWTGVRKQHLAQLRSYGWTRQRIAEYFNTTPSNIATTIDRLDLARRTYVPFTMQELAQIKELRDRGWHPGIIAGKLEIKPERVRYAIRYYSKKGKGPWGTTGNAK